MFIEWSSLKSVFGSFCVFGAEFLKKFESDPHNCAVWPIYKSHKKTRSTKRPEFDITTPSRWNWPNAETMKITFLHTKFSPTSRQLRQKIYEWFKGRRTSSLQKCSSYLPYLSETWRKLGKNVHDFYSFRAWPISTGRSSILLRILTLNLDKTWLLLRT